MKSWAVLAVALMVAAARGQTSQTGGLSEEEFKKLHELRSAPEAQPHGQMIDLGTGKAYLSLPREAKAPLPALVVIHEWWGLNDNIKHWSDRLADEGYAALAVDLYGGKVADNPDTAMQLMKAVKADEAVAILLKAHAFLASDPRIKAKKRGSIGWCFGGAQSLALALHAPDLDAAVIYYGPPVTDPAELKKIKARTLAIYGTKDPSIPKDRVDALEKGLKEAGVKAEILRYDANHAFANPSNPNYDMKNASAAWEKVRAFLKETLKS